MSRRKKTAAKKLLEVSNQTAMLTTFNEVDMTNVMDLRKRKKEQFIKDHDGTKSVSYTHLTLPTKRIV